MWLIIAALISKKYVKKLYKIVEIYATNLKLKSYLTRKSIRPRRKV